MSAGEFERIVKLDRLPSKSLTIEASESERAELARRFDLPVLHTLTAEVSFTPVGEAVEARGHIRASFDQCCALSSEPFANTLDEQFTVRFVLTLAAHDEQEEIEFTSDAPDEIEYDGAAFDIGEAVAQSFGLALDPYAEGPNADAARREAGILDETVPSGPFAALAALKSRSQPN